MTERIKYGDEERVELSDGTPAFVPCYAKKCPDCGVEQGRYHLLGCDQEQCPKCETQLLSCDHKVAE